MEREFDDTPEYLAEWAGKVAGAIEPDELRLLIRIHRNTASNKRIPEADRKAARRRANALRKFLNK